MLVFYVSVARRQQGQGKDLFPPKCMNWIYTFNAMSLFIKCQYLVSTDRLSSPMLLIKPAFLNEMKTLFNTYSVIHKSLHR